MRSDDAVDRSAGSRAYEAILQKIQERTIEPGSYLREEALARDLDISRTPIRQAIRDLASDGVVEVIPHRGARVIEYTSANLVASLDVRARLEPLACRLAVPRMTRSSLETAMRLCDEMEEATAGPVDSVRLSGLNRDFHALFAQACGNSQLQASIEAASRRAAVLQTFESYRRESLNRSMRHHRELVAAAADRDGEWAEAVMLTHLLAARSSARRMDPVATVPPTAAAE